MVGLADLPPALWALLPQRDLAAVASTCRALRHTVRNVPVRRASIKAEHVVSALEQERFVGIRELDIKAPSIGRNEPLEVVVPARVAASVAASVTALHLRWCRLDVGAFGNLRHVTIRWNMYMPHAARLATELRGVVSVIAPRVETLGVITCGVSFSKSEPIVSETLREYTNIGCAGIAIDAPSLRRARVDWSSSIVSSKTLERLDAFGERAFLRFPTLRELHVRLTFWRHDDLDTYLRELRLPPSLERVRFTIDLTNAEDRSVLVRAWALQILPPSVSRVDIVCTYPVPGLDYVPLHWRAVARICAHESITAAWKRELEDPELDPDSEEAEELRTLIDENACCDDVPGIVWL